jgi:hypothetical protein
LPGLREDLSTDAVLMVIGLVCFPMVVVTSMYVLNYTTVSKKIHFIVWLKKFKTGGVQWLNLIILAIGL